MQFFHDVSVGLLMSMEKRVMFCNVRSVQHDRFFVIEMPASEFNNVK